MLETMDKQFREGLEFRRVRATVLIYLRRELTSVMRERLLRTTPLFATATLPFDNAFSSEMMMKSILCWADCGSFNSRSRDCPLGQCRTRASEDLTRPEYSASEWLEEDVRSSSRTASPFICAVPPLVPIAVA